MMLPSPIYRCEIVFGQQCVEGWWYSLWGWTKDSTHMPAPLHNTLDGERRRETADCSAVPTSPALLLTDSSDYSSSCYRGNIDRLIWDLYRDRHWEINDGLWCSQLHELRYSYNAIGRRKCGLWFKGAWLFSWARRCSWLKKKSTFTLYSTLCWPIFQNQFTIFYGMKLWCPTCGLGGCMRPCGTYCVSLKGYAGKGCFS